MDELKKSIDKLTKTVIHATFILITFLVEMYLINIYCNSKIEFISLSVFVIWIMNTALLHTLHNKK